MEQRLENEHHYCYCNHACPHVSHCADEHTDSRNHIPALQRTVYNNYFTNSARHGDANSNNVYNISNNKNNNSNNSLNNNNGYTYYLYNNINDSKIPQEYYYNYSNINNNHNSDNRNTNSAGSSGSYSNHNRYYNVYTKEARPNSSNAQITSSNYALTAPTKAQRDYENQNANITTSNTIKNNNKDNDKNISYSANNNDHNNDKWEYAEIVQRDGSAHHSSVGSYKANEMQPLHVKDTKPVYTNVAYDTHQEQPYEKIHHVPYSNSFLESRSYAQVSNQHQPMAIEKKHARHDESNTVENSSKEYHEFNNSKNNNGATEQHRMQEIIHGESKASNTHEQLGSLVSLNTATPAKAATSTATTTPLTVTSSQHRRPLTDLTTHLVKLYKEINAEYCLERRKALPGPLYNNGYDDNEGHYLVMLGEEILQRYSVKEVLGKGSFGTVVRCYDEKRKEMVALKITRMGSNFREQAKIELNILLKLNENVNLNHLIVRLLKVFDWQGHLVLVFELLSFNLYQLIKCTRYNGVSLDLVRKFAYQLVHTLLQLEINKPYPIIHCDIKPENILLKNENRSGIRLIDFGSACYTNRRIHHYIQSRFYRSPEVILGLEYTTAIDRWSLGCVLVEMHTGMPLFDGGSEIAQLARFEAILGPIPASMIAASPHVHHFYNCVICNQDNSNYHNYNDHNNSNTNGYNSYNYHSNGLGPSYHSGPCMTYVLKRPIPPRCSLETILGVTTGGPRGSRKDSPGHDEASYRQFHDFVARLLRLEPSMRISCHDALRHPFLGPLFTTDQQQSLTTSLPEQQKQQQSPLQPGSQLLESKKLSQSKEVTEERELKIEQQEQQRSEWK